MNEKAVSVGKLIHAMEAQKRLWQEYITEDLPSSYDENRLVALIRDPYTMFIYWDMAEDTYHMVEDFLGQKLNDVQFFARVYEFNGERQDPNSSSSLQTIPLAPMANNWYVKDLSPNCSYFVDIGIMVKGNFITILRSNQVSTPPDTYGPNREHWFDQNHQEVNNLELWSSNAQGFSANSSISFYRES